KTDQTITIADGEIIDPTIARALPFLSHGQMLAAGRQAERRKLAAYETILRQGEAVEHFYLIASGGVEIKAAGADHSSSPEIILAALGPGQFFGETELLSGGHALAQVQSDEHGAELLRLPRQVFETFIRGSALTQQTLNEIAAMRHAENASKTGAAHR
ncbi:MAG: cyclic nucleotide-binding domain-containing protein, partial [Chloroflexota bacterium]